MKEPGLFCRRRRAARLGAAKKRLTVLLHATRHSATFNQNGAVEMGANLNQINEDIIASVALILDKQSKNVDHRLLQLRQQPVLAPGFRDWVQTRGRAKFQK